MCNAVSSGWRFAATSSHHHSKVSSTSTFGAEATFSMATLAGTDVSNYVEMLYNPNRQHDNNIGLSPMHFEQ